MSVKYGRSISVGRLEVSPREKCGTVTSGDPRLNLGGCLPEAPEKEPTKRINYGVPEGSDDC